MVYKITIGRVSMRMLIPVAVAFFVVAGTAPAFAEVVIEPLPGSATAGCELTELGCYNYPVLRVNPGTEITFLNTDNAAHTLTSGSSAVGPTGVFDSNLVLVGSWYKFTLEEEGTYEHFCLVHPWMTGRIIVESETTPVEDAPAPAPAPPPSTPSSMENRIKALEAMIEELKDMIEKLTKRVDAMAASTAKTTPLSEPSSVPSSDSPFYIQVNGTSYSLGDRIGFSGQLPDACPPTVYNVDDTVRERALAYISMIYESSDDLIRFGQLTCDADMEEFSFIEKVPLDTDGSFDDSWQVDNEFPRGEYRVKIEPTLDRIFDYKAFYSEQFSIQ